MILKKVVCLYDGEEKNKELLEKVIEEFSGELSLKGFVPIVELYSSKENPVKANSFDLGINLSLEKEDLDFFEKLECKNKIGIQRKSENWHIPDVWSQYFFCVSLAPEFNPFTLYDLYRKVFGLKLFKEEFVVENKGISSLWKKMYFLLWPLILSDEDLSCSPHEIAIEERSYWEKVIEVCSYLRESLDFSFFYTKSLAEKTSLEEQKEIGEKIQDCDKLGSVLTQKLPPLRPFWEYFMLQQSQIPVGTIPEMSSQSCYNIQNFLGIIMALEQLILDSYKQVV